MSDYLPSELLISIFTRLPVETIVRCSLVCKSWYSLITNPAFISQHLKFNQSIAKDDRHLLVRRVLYTDPKKEIYTLHCDNESFDEYAKLNLSLKSVGSFFTIVGNCNGLLCLLDERNSVDPVKNIFLWNPMIKKSITLPKYKFFSSHVESTGFGFDPLTNDYKVIRIVHLAFPKVSSRVEFYSLSTGEWRNISHLAIPNYVVYGHSGQANLNGAIHWLAHGGLNASVRLVILFDLHDEVFRVMKLPNGIVHTKTASLHLAVIQESLSLICHTCSIVVENYCNIWIMREYGRADSWTKQRRVDFLPYFGEPRYFSKNGKVLLCDNEGFLLSYDLEDASVTTLCRYDNANSSLSLYVESFTESLVLLDQKANVRRRSYYTLLN